MPEPTDEDIVAIALAIRLHERTADEQMHQDEETMHMVPADCGCIQCGDGVESCGTLYDLQERMDALLDQRLDVAAR